MIMSITSFDFKILWKDTYYKGKPSSVKLTVLNYFHKTQENEVGVGGVDK